VKLFGLTGGIGMGKSTASEWLLHKHIPFVDTDSLARRIVEPGSPALKEIERAFGANCIDATGCLRRETLAAIVFSDAAARQTLESISHPIIRKLWKAQVETWRAQCLPLGVVVIPLLFETGAEQELDATVCIACSASTQQKRLADRGWTPAQIEQRLAAQWPIHQKIAKAKFVAWSEGPIDVLGAQLERIFEGAGAVD
jgi:dephospho-CoA kinase